MVILAKFLNRTGINEIDDDAIKFLEQEIKEAESILIIKQNDGSETQSLKLS